MYRRIELILHFLRKEEGSATDRIRGLCGYGIEDVVNAWVSMNNPRKEIKKNVRFYFTEAGWEKYSRDTVAACIRSKQEYRILAVEGHEVDVVYKDEYQACIRPKRKVRRKNSNNLLVG
ncbi:MAG: hypothetical protein P4L50_22935 [Anaerolineaceae bacterium]|nr:hypothetical protein [Anaerolineaceae bacterium]